MRNAFVTNMTPVVRVTSLHQPPQLLFASKLPSCYLKIEASSKMLSGETRVASQVDDQAADGTIHCQYAHQVAVQTAANACKMIVLQPPSDLADNVG